MTKTRNHRVHLRLTSPKVRAAKAIWDNSRHHSQRRRSLTFARLLRYFANDKLRFSDIAEMSGLSSERVRQVYAQHFQALFGNRSGRDRHNFYFRRRTDASMRAGEARLFAQDELRLVIRHARAASCTVASVPTRNSKYGATPKVNSLNINGYLCSVLRSTRLKKGPDARRGYVPFKLARSVVQKVDALILYCATAEFPHRVFVVPRRDLLPLFKGTRARMRSVYVPAEKRPILRSHQPRIEFWQYENAWHHLKRRRQRNALRTRPR
jgi:hypothetical protein